MLHWLAAPTYNRFDVLWIALVVLAWHDRRYFAAVVFAVVGVSLSAILEVWSNHS